MTLPSSGPLSLSDIQGEFGGSNPISITEYYAGGGLVPTGTTGTYGAVPSSGAISIRNFYGTTKGNTVTVGTYFDGTYTHYGYESGVPYGSISPTTWPIDGGTIYALYWININVLGFSLVGSHANSGWTNMNVAGTLVNRASASYNNSGYYTTWTWSGTANPFGTTVGATKLVTWS